MEEALEALARRAAAGDQAALDELVRAVQDDVYGLAMRMLGHPADAEDATQEILVKLVTRLSSFRGESGLRTWIWSIAANHIASVRRSRREPDGLTFEGFEQMLAAGLAADNAMGEPPEEALLEEEVKLGCTQSMLMCLDRDHRAAFVLGEVYDLKSEEGAEVLGIQPAAFRKRVSRARERMRDFMERNCGLVSEEAPCRCRRQIRPSVQAGLVDPSGLVYATHPAREPAVKRAYEAIETGERFVSVLRDQPRYAAPDSILEAFRRLLASA